MIPTDKDYDFRSGYHLEVSPIFFNRAISRAERNGITVIQSHSHPFTKDELWYSPSDNSGESISAKTLYDCLNEKPMGSLLFGQDRVIGRAWLSPGSKPVQIDQIRIVDRHLQFQNIGSDYKSKAKIDVVTYDRQIRAFGLKGQELLSQLTVGIIGVGGTGSSIAEQLSREGVKNFVIVDQDKFEVSNKTRVYGSYSNDKDKYKVEIVKRNIQKIQPDAKVKEIPKNVISQEVLQELKNCDVVFSCTDRHAPRSVVNELAHQFFIPVIDIGVGLDAKNNKIEGGSVRATLVSPSLPCMYCIGVVNSETILSESLSKSDREAREKEGYIKGLQDDAPSVITFTTMAASFGLLLFKDLIFNVVDTKANTITLDVTTFKTSRLAASVKDDCVCTSRMGKADYMPLSAP
ncbi:MAG: ThiF family adenylyltransferase, partial [Nitrosotalea sp.]